MSKYGGLDMFENNDKAKRIKWIVTGVCVFWISMFLTGVMMSVNEHVGKDTKIINSGYERVIE